MGHVPILTKEQQVILAEVKETVHLKNFYFTGGTALSAFYLHHRYSEDLDLEPFIVASNFLNVDEFDDLPRMIAPLKIEDLKTFFRQEAKKLGRTAVI